MSARLCKHGLPAGVPQACEAMDRRNTRRTVGVKGFGWWVSSRFEIALSASVYNLNDQSVDQRAGNIMMLPSEWCSPIITPGVDLTKPGIYKWEIAGVGVYIGKYTRSSRPTREYRRNVERILAKQLSHHKNGEFRRIHHALAQAVREGTPVTLTILANGEKEDLNRIERDFIISEKANLNGRAPQPPVVILSD